MVDEFHSNADGFSRIPERNTGDALLRGAQAHHVTLSSMADTKANILITVSSIVLTLSYGRMDDPALPKYRALKISGDSLPAGFNPLFFGHFASLSRERFLIEITRAMRPDGSVYEAMANDLYSIGWYLAHRKYRYLRYSYLFFLAGFVLACIEQGWRLLMH
jgi:hypothetical protein